MKKWSFVIGSVLTALGAVLHFAIIIGGPDWYRASGAGEKLAQIAASGSLYPAFLGTCLAFIFLGWSAYALSGAGLIGRLPLLKFALPAIALLCTVRGVYGFFVPFFVKTGYVINLGVGFWVYSSLIWLTIGLSYFAGISLNWTYIANKHE
ncbi:hypothetical protein QWI17_02125 [Gilvimarinus sp. SDUM040013]|uniref:DUF3995 domain-containing protein n=1 Tax=Gilvimarinus gilvus TaxID=3058038 RepID=A0ABU4RZ94_9GAMM|nr:hypothetical protein [Gilvimarinus sp. SDUM040013]MDO3384628.1 hypothetical protein [Gilvimarinus sp. SDUM040013]MDX6850214.1 hypothetical protein [Gilvimarinus sp. SDUM040013]